MSQIVPNLSNPSEYYTNDFTDMIYDDYYFGGKFQDIQLDGLNCGVPTRTTPTITPVTPTTLLDQTMLHFQMEAQSHQNEAGFVPPLVQPPMTSVPNSTSGNMSTTTSIQDSIGGGIYLNMVNEKNWQGGSTIITDIPALSQMNRHSDNMSPIPPHIISLGSGSSSSSSISSSSSSSGRKNIGGRRPNRESGISPEEEERRKMRRERNKQAAARCRKRRVDHTNELLRETAELDTKRQCLEKELEKATAEIESLKRILEAHEPSCRLRISDSPPDIKPFITNPELNEQFMDCDEKSLGIGGGGGGGDNDPQMYNLAMGIPTSVCNSMNPVTSMSSGMGKQRPNYLPLGSFAQPKLNIPISTPSSEFIDSLIEGGTGLTPITSAIVSSCSTQLRSSNGMDLSSPETSGKKLVSL